MAAPWSFFWWKFLYFSALPGRPLRPYWLLLFGGGFILLDGLGYCPIDKTVQAFALSLCVGFKPVFAAFRHSQLDLIIVFFFVFCDRTAVCIAFNCLILTSMRIL